ncbi:hypothetical protein [Desulforamulus aquiferis]|uniref:Uncharacterized protein n=1 Tax=Desulforamulus aquiferis TaxID=1397668 RepID=A0AAW7ZC89_9FIRM|nr:hypothetical protein [Desulforamulus aquiferis]MDO7786898.1 hypothetical protein [Desulforamulus aquiferis]
MTNRSRWEVRGPAQKDDPVRPEPFPLEAGEAGEVPAKDLQRLAVTRTAITQKTSQQGLA